MVLEKAISNFIHHLVLRERSGETTRGYKNVLNAFGGFMKSRFEKDVQVTEITLLDLEDYLEYHQKKGSHAQTRNRIIYILRSFYSYLYNRELIEKNISMRLETIPVKEKERTFLIPEEVVQLIENIDHDLVRIAAITLANTGLRIGELSNLRLTDVDLETHIIKVREGKGNKDRVVPINYNLTGVLKNYLDELRPQVKSDYFFATPRTGKLSRQTVNEHLIETAKRMGWNKHVTAHILRHSFASALVRHNASLSAVQTLLGHSDLKVTSRYIHQNLDQLHAAVNCLCEFRETQVIKNPGEPENKNEYRLEEHLRIPESEDYMKEFMRECRQEMNRIQVKIEKLEHCFYQQHNELNCGSAISIDEQKKISLPEILLTMIEEFSREKNMSKENVIEVAILEFLGSAQ